MNSLWIQKIRKSFGRRLLQLVFVTSSLSGEGQTDEGSNTPSQVRKVFEKIELLVQVLGTHQFVIGRGVTFCEVVSSVAFSRFPDELKLVHFDSVL